MDGRVEERRGLSDSEMLLRRLTDEIPSIIWSMDANLVCTAAAGGPLRDLGLRPSDAIGMTLSEFFQTEDAQSPVVAAHRRAIQGETVSFEHERRGRVFQSRVSPLWDDNGTIIGCTGISQDVSGACKDNTDRKQAEEALRQSEQRHRQIIETSTEGVWIIDAEANTVFGERFTS